MMGSFHHYHLRDSESDNGVDAVLVPTLGGKRTDQILASEAFDYLIDDDPDTEHILKELSFLASNEFVNEEQRARISVYLDLVGQIQSIRMGQTETELSAAQLAELTQRALIEDLEGDDLEHR